MNLEWLCALYWFAGFLVGFGIARSSFRSSKNKIIHDEVKDLIEKINQREKVRIAQCIDPDSYLQINLSNKND